MTTDWWRCGAGELATAIRERRVTSREVVQSHLARIEAVNPHLNAVVRVLADQALADADRADQAVASNAELGPLHGVPFTIKENIDAVGSPTTQAVHAFADALPPSDAPVVARMKAAGAIPLGRTNLPDFGLRVHTDSSLHGLTRNPWNPRLTAGGSSGGEASALASGMSPIGLGNDLGGSLRNPAHCCGVASIKPTVGRVGHTNAFPPQDPSLMFQLMAVQGVLARRISDVRLGLGVIAGAHPGDPISVPLTFDPTSGRGPCRVAVLPEPPGGATDLGIAAAVRAGAESLAAAGYDVVETAPPDYERAIHLWGELLLAEIGSLLPLLSMVLGTDAMNFIGYARERFNLLDLDGVAQGHIERHTMARQWSLWFEEFPLLLTPVWAKPAFPHGYDIGSADQAWDVFETMRPVLPPNLLGLPAAVAPAGMANGMPVGVQLIGQRFDEASCLDAAEIVEAASGVLTPIDPVV